MYQPNRNGAHKVVTEKNVGRHSPINYEVNFKHISTSAHHNSTIDTYVFVTGLIVYIYLSLTMVTKTTCLKMYSPCDISPRNFPFH